MSDILVVRRLYSDFVLRDRTSAALSSLNTTIDGYQAKVDRAESSTLGMGSTLDTATEAFRRQQIVVAEAERAQLQASLAVGRQRLAVNSATAAYRDAAAALKSKANATDADRAALAALDTELQRQIQLQRQAETTLLEATQALNEQKAVERDCAEEYDKATEAMNKQNAAMEAAQARSDKLRNALLGVGAALTAVGVAGTLYFTSVAKSYGTYSTMLIAYNNMAGDSADSLMAKMRAATKESVSDSNLILAANRAMAMGIAEEGLPRLAEIAEAAARIMGTDTTDMFNNIVTGIARGSPLILDNLGIIVSISEANEAYAETIGKSASALSAAEQQQALLNAVMDQGQILVDKAGATTDNATLASDRLAASTKNLNIAMGTAANGPMTAWYNLLTALADRLAALPTPLLTTITMIGMAATAISSVIGPLMIQAAALMFLRTQWASYKAELAVTPAYAAIAAAGFSPLIASLGALAAAAWAAITPFLPLVLAALALAGAAALVDVGINGWDKSLLGTMFSSPVNTENATNQTFNITQNNSIEDNSQITTTAEITAEEIQQIMTEQRERWASRANDQLKQELTAYL